MLRRNKSRHERQRAQHQSESLGLVVAMGTSPSRNAVLAQIAVIAFVVTVAALGMARLLGDVRAVWLVGGVLLLLAALGLWRWRK
jgi:hypothetical protein